MIPVRIITILWWPFYVYKKLYNHYKNSLIPNG